jgi:alkylation response protein AidB-like acyl-CoA dehydrogenase
MSWNEPVASCLVSRITRHDDAPEKLGSVIHTIFEGTSEIQQLVISRAISGLRIE